MNDGCEVLMINNNWFEFGLFFFYSTQFTLVRTSFIVIHSFYYVNTVVNSRCEHQKKEHECARIKYAILIMFDMNAVRDCRNEKLIWSFDSACHFCMMKCRMSQRFQSNLHSFSFTTHDLQKKKKKNNMKWLTNRSNNNRRNW